MTENDDFENRLRWGLHDLAGAAEPPPTLPTAVLGRMGEPGYHQRRLVLGAIAAAIVVVAATLVVLSGRGGNHRNVATLAPTSAATATTATTVPVLPLVTSPPATSSTTLVTSTTASTTTATTAPPVITTAPSSTTTTVTTVASGECSAADLRTTTATDHSTYSTGQTVIITVTVRNVTTTSCQIQTPYPQTFASTIKITTPGGTLVWAPKAAVAGIFTIPTPRVLAPGQLYVWTTAQWDQHFCIGTCYLQHTVEGAAVQAGKYVAQPNDGLPTPSPAAPATFTIQ